MLVRYANHLYRRAQDEEAPSAEVYVKAAEELLSKAGISGPVMEKALKIEADGLDVPVNVGASWAGIQAILSLDYAKKGDGAKLQEAILDMCEVGYVAKRGKETKELLQAIKALQTATYHSSEPIDEDKVEGEKAQRDFVEYYVTELMEGGQDLDYDHKNEFTKQIREAVEAGEYPADRGNKLASYVDAMEEVQWLELVQVIEESRRRKTSPVDIIDDAVRQLTAHEAYTGEVIIVGYADGNPIVALEVDKPIDSMLFVFDYQRGARVDLVDAALGICGSYFVSGNNLNLAKELVSAAAILMEAEGRSANPEISQPPTGESKSKDWEKENLDERMKNGLVIWQSKSGDYRYVTKMSQGTVGKGRCMQKDNYTNMWEDKESELHNLINLNNIKDVFLVDYEGNVHLLDTKTGNTAKKNIGKINMPDQYSCPAS